jgi:protein-S-isoprenylcysteine O-methyltransferase Ste14
MWMRPVGFVQFGAFWAIMLVGAAAMLRAFYRARGPAGAERKSARSKAGIFMQFVGFFAVGFGPIHIAVPWNAPSSLFSTALVVLLEGGAVAMFAASTRTMGKNWSIVARMRSDHQLIQTGPFAIVRHPIYLALLLYLLSMAVAFGHYGQLAIGLPFYCLGTVIRIREEEKLLSAQFGDDHARYVRDVPAFIPFTR